MRAPRRRGSTCASSKRARPEPVRSGRLTAARTLEASRGCSVPETGFARSAARTLNETTALTCHGACWERHRQLRLLRLLQLYDIEARAEGGGIGVPRRTHSTLSRAAC